MMLEMPRSVSVRTEEDAVLVEVKAALPSWTGKIMPI